MGKRLQSAGKGAILRTALLELGLDVVFAGARQVNNRSQKAQAKLSYIQLHVENEYPEEHAFLEQKEKQPCVLHAFKKADFLRHLQ